MLLNYQFMNNFFIVINFFTGSGGLHGVGASVIDASVVGGPPYQMFFT